MGNYALISVIQVCNKRWNPTTRTGGFEENRIYQREYKRK